MDFPFKIQGLELRVQDLEFRVEVMLSGVAALNPKPFPMRGERLMLCVLPGSVLCTGSWARTETNPKAPNAKP